MGVLIPIIIMLVVGFIMFKTFGGVFKQMQNRKRLAQEGTLAIAYVQSISQTGVTVNQSPEMLLSLQIENVGGQPRQLQIKQLIDLGSIPRAGDKVYVMIDPKDPNNVVLSQSPTGNGMQVAMVDEQGKTTNTVDLSSNSMKAFMALSPQLRENSKLGIAKVVNITSVDGRNYQIILDVDNIGQPLKRITLNQIIDNIAPSINTRVYFMYDPKDPSVMALAPSALMGNQYLGPDTNRLDALVLGPQLLQIGAKAAGTVMSAKQIPLVNQLLTDKGYSKWELALNVKPQDTTPPYQANLTISLSSAEKAARIAHIGAEVPLRYDPLDLQTIGIDSIAMGYPDPYEAAIKAFTDGTKNLA